RGLPDEIDVALCEEIPSQDGLSRKPKYNPIEKRAGSGILWIAHELELLALFPVIEAEGPGSNGCAGCRVALELPRAIDVLGQDLERDKALDVAYARPRETDLQRARPGLPKRLEPLEIGSRRGRAGLWIAELLECKEHILDG